MNTPNDSTEVPELRLKRGEDRRLSAGHLWVFSNEVDTGRTPLTDFDEWSEAHRRFHRALLDGCGNPVLLEGFDRLWTASELTRHWSGLVDPDRDPAGEHAALEEAALSRDADRAADLLARHVRHTAEVLRD